MLDSVFCIRLNRNFFSLYNIAFHVVLYITCTNIAIVNYVMSIDFIIVVNHLTYCTLQSLESNILLKKISPIARNKNEVLEDYSRWLELQRFTMGLRYFLFEAQ